MPTAPKRRDMRLYLWHYRFDSRGRTVTRESLPYVFRTIEQGMLVIEDMRPALKAVHSNPLTDDVILLIRYPDDYIAYWEML